MRYYVVSDVHGFYDLLVRALEAKGFFDDPTPHKLVVCGDLYDMGGQPRELENFIYSLLKRDEVVLVRGNHEDMLTELADNAYKWFCMGGGNSHHFRNGTVDTLLKLTDMTLTEAAERADEVAKRAYGTPTFTALLPAMRNYFETDGYVFVHGWIPCEASGYGGRAYSYSYDPDWREASEQDWYFARWYNGIRAYSQGVRERGKTIVCGHWHASYGHSALEGKGTEFEEGADFTPFKAEGIIALDACTVCSGFINCEVIED